MEEPVYKVRNIQKQRLLQRTGRSNPRCTIQDKNVGPNDSVQEHQPNDEPVQNNRLN